MGVLTALKPVCLAEYNSVSFHQYGRQNDVDHASLAAEAAAGQKYAGR